MTQFKLTDLRKITEIHEKLSLYALFPALGLGDYIGVKFSLNQNFSRSHEQIIDLLNKLIDLFRKSNSNIQYYDYQEFDQLFFGKKPLSLLFEQYIILEMCFQCVLELFFSHKNGNIDFDSFNHWILKFVSLFSKDSQESSNFLFLQDMEELAVPLNKYLNLLQENFKLDNLRLKANFQYFKFHGKRLPFYHISKFEKKYNKDLARLLNKKTPIDGSYKILNYFTDKGVRELKQFINLGIKFIEITEEKTFESIQSSNNYGAIIDDNFVLEGRRFAIVTNNGHAIVDVVIQYGSIDKLRGRIIEILGYSALSQPWGEVYGIKKQLSCLAAILLGFPIEFVTYEKSAYNYYDTAQGIIGTYAPLLRSKQSEMLTTLQIINLDKSFAELLFFQIVEEYLESGQINEKLSTICLAFGISMIIDEGNGNIQIALEERMVPYWFNHFKSNLKIYTYDSVDILKEFREILGKLNNHRYIRNRQVSLVTTSINRDSSAGSIWVYLERLLNYPKYAGVIGQENGEKNFKDKYTFAEKLGDKKPNPVHDYFNHVPSYHYT